MVDGERRDPVDEARDGAERHLHAVGARDVEARQGGRIAVEIRLRLEQDLVLGRRAVDRRHLALAEGVVEGLVDRRQRNPQPRGRVAVDLDGEMTRGDLLIGAARGSAPSD